MPEEKKDKQDRMIEILQEMLKWTRVTSIPHVKKLLLDTLPSDKEKIAYHFSDGRDSRDVAKIAGVHFTTIARWWKIWTRVGIAESLSTRGGERSKSIFPLEDFGIELPTIKKVGSSEKAVETPIQEPRQDTEESSEVKVIKESENSKGGE